MAILAGDYLLARASISLARLRQVDVVECMSTIIEHLVRGEVMQMKGTSTSESRLTYYLRKNYYKTGSLMANSCRSAALLGSYSPELVDCSYRYGKHIGMAFQLVDDVLDFEGSAEAMGKASLSDVNAGIATAPVLYALQSQNDTTLQTMMDRKFRQDGDVERTVELVLASDGMERTKELAQVHAELAVDAVLKLQASEHRDALVRLAYKVVDRTR
jgi:geranylgeranyl pyrophosphate synthase